MQAHHSILSNTTSKGFRYILKRTKLSWVIIMMRFEVPLPQYSYRTGPPCLWLHLTVQFKVWNYMGKVKYMSLSHIITDWPQSDDSMGRINATTPSMQRQTFEHYFIITGWSHGKPVPTLLLQYIKSNWGRTLASKPICDHSWYQSQWRRKLFALTYKIRSCITDVSMQCKQVAVISILNSSDL